MIDLTIEAPITLAEATRLPVLRRNGKPRHFSTLLRWTQRGIDGHRLETCKIGGTTCTTEAAILRFIERLSHPEGADTTRTSAQRERAGNRAMEELSGAGI